jgi:hypothetical protein
VTVPIGVVVRVNNHVVSSHSPGGI